MEKNKQAPEGKLIGDALKRSGLSARKASAMAGISDSRWRHVVNGYQPIGNQQSIPIQAPAETLARMAHVVRVTPEQLKEAGREDAADVMQELWPHGDNSEETLHVVGQLVVKARLRLELSQIGLARKAGIDVKTLRSLENGVHLPQQVQRDKIEKALDWKPGAIGDIWDNREGDLDLGALTLVHMEPPTDPMPDEMQRANIAAQLTDAELLYEISHRFTQYARQAEHEDPSSRDRRRN